MFRAQLLLEEQRRLYDVWTSAAGANAMPSRESFQPRAFGPLLPFISLVEVQDGQANRIRVAGSALRDVFGGDPEMCLRQIGASGAADTIVRVAMDGKPACGVAQVVRACGSGCVCHWAWATQSTRSSASISPCVVRGLLTGPCNKWQALSVGSVARVSPFLQR
jgi:hypothetical protein